MFTPPPRHGLAASRYTLPRGPWATVLEALTAAFAHIPPPEWQARFDRGLVLAEQGELLSANAPAREGLVIHYYREVAAEPRIPFEATVLHADAHLVVADKPHFLPVTPAGRFVRETLLARLTEALDNPDLVPLHRIDRTTAGLALFSANAQSRAAYQALFRGRALRKHYEALAPALPRLGWPHTRQSRIEAVAPFPCMGEVAGPANSETRLTVLAEQGAVWRYGLEPITGKKHQLRVHMAALGAPIVNDELYPVPQRLAAEDYRTPLQLLAKALEFTDPVSGERRRFESERGLLG